MKVVGIDPGTAACGYGVVAAQAGRLSAVAHGWWRTSPREPPERRLKRIHDAVVELIRSHAPDAVVLEESYVGADARTALFVGQARGAVLVACAGADVVCAEYAPTAVKQAVCGYGHADKEQVQKVVKMTLGMRETPKPTHAADALAVAICHALAPPLRTLAGAGA